MLIGSMQAATERMERDAAEEDSLSEHSGLAQLGGLQSGVVR